MSKEIPRVYEYLADDGTTYWSFTKHTTTVSQPKRLILQNRKGTVLNLFLRVLRMQGFMLMQEQETTPEDADPSV